MKFVWAILSVLLCFFAFKYIRIFFKRVVLYFRVSGFCKENHLELVKNHFLWAFGRKASGRCDFYIVAEKTVFSVKLFSMPKRSSYLIFNDNGYYSIKRFISMIGNIGQHLRIPLESNPKKLSDIDFFYNCSPDWSSKTYRSVFLINPTCIEVRRVDSRGRETILINGNLVYGMEIHTLSSLLSEVKLTLANN